MRHPAYNEVTPATGLKRRQLSPPPLGPPGAAVGPHDWPPSLQEFVQRCFAAAADMGDAAKTTLHSQLLQLIALAINGRMVWTNDWTRQTLPVLAGSAAAVALVGPEETAKAAATSAAKAATDEADSGSRERKRQRMERFAAPALPTKPSFAPSLAAIVGTCQELEKHYLRLTLEPDPSKVRPEAVLKRLLNFVLAKYHQRRDAGDDSAYLYVNAQFKLIRQDLTVQHIKNDFTISVYETHGRIAIENSDLGEFNQCQSQLRFLYAKRQGDDHAEAELEFVCYRAVYMLMTGNSGELYKIQLERRVRAPSLERILELQRCMVLGHYHRFFAICRALRQQPQMRLACKLIDAFLMEKQRIRALNVISRLYRKLSTSHLASVLDYSEAELGEFMRKFKLSPCVSNHELDCVQSRAILQDIVVQQGFRKIDIKGQV